MTSALPSEAPGWYGKLPSLGDFAQRRLPPAFVGAWDDWLAAELGAWQQAQPAGWLERYLAGASWRFLLLPGCMPGVAAPAGMAGVLMPSVDRVGRYFPLTIAWALEDAPADPVALQRLFALTHDLDDLALDALEDDWTPQRLDDELAAFTCRVARMKSGAHAATPVPGFHPGYGPAAAAAAATSGHGADAAPAAATSRHGADAAAAAATSRHGADAAAAATAPGHGADAAAAAPAPGHASATSATPPCASPAPWTGDLPPPGDAVDIPWRSDIAGTLGALAWQRLLAHWHGGALWWSEPRPGRIRLRVGAGLPRGDAFVALFSALPDDGAASATDRLTGEPTP